jgi:twitching motility protein PilU
MTSGVHAIEPHATLRSFLEHMARIEASDLYLTADFPPVFRVNDVTYTGRVALSADEISSMGDSLMNVTQRRDFRANLEMNLTFSLADNVRFRVNLFWQRGTPALVVRSLRTTIKTLDELGHPTTIKTLALSRYGLVLVVGRRGSGISSTLAAMIDQRNASETGHILTIEDPIEYIHPSKQCVVTQREVGVDTRSYAEALNNALRQSTDVIAIDTIRSADVLESALAFADSGRLCISTLHAVNVTQAIHRMLSLFSPTRHAEILLRLSLALRGVVAQRLVPSLGGGRVGALELLLDTPRIKDMIRVGKIDALEEAMEQDDVQGCCSFDASLLALLRAGRVSEADALNAAESRSDFAQGLGRPREPERVRALDSSPPELDVPLRLAQDLYEPEPAIAPAAAAIAPRASRVGGR